MRPQYLRVSALWGAAQQVAVPPGSGASSRNGGLGASGTALGWSFRFHFAPVECGMLKVASLGFCLAFS